MAACSSSVVIPEDCGDRNVSVKQTTGEQIGRNGPLAHGAPATYDVIVEGATEPGEAAALDKIRAFHEAGATWWLEALWGLADGASIYTPAAQAKLIERVTLGPPRID